MDDEGRLLPPHMLGRIEQWMEVAICLLGAWMIHASGIPTFIYTYTERIPTVCADSEWKKMSTYAEENVYVRSLKALDMPLSSMLSASNLDLVHRLC